MESNTSLRPQAHQVYVDGSDQTVRFYG